jgi:hypothetical protein
MENQRATAQFPREAHWAQCLCGSPMNRHSSLREWRRGVAGMLEFHGNRAKPAEFFM